MRERDIASATESMGKHLFFEHSEALLEKATVNHCSLALSVLSLMLIAGNLTTKKKKRHSLSS